MATTDILVLPSSPLKQFSTYNIPSSPALLSPHEIFRSKEPLTATGGRTPLITKAAVASFTSTTTLAKKHSFDDLPSAGALRPPNPSSHDNHTSSYFNVQKPAKSRRKESSTSDKPTRESNVKAQRKLGSDEPKAKKTKKPRAKKVEGCEGGIKAADKVPTRKPRSKKADKEKAENGLEKDKLVRKPRTKKVDGDSQPKLPKGRVTKSSLGPAPNNICGTSKSTKVESAREKYTDPFSDSFDYGLVKAVNRRTNWTPPSNSEKTLLFDQGSVPIELGRVASIVPDEENKGFNDLVHNFGFVPSETRVSETDSLNGAGTKKRKLLELVQTNVIATTTAPKAKGPRKKPRTITDLATSAYAQEPMGDVSEIPAPLLQYFSYQTNGCVTKDGFKIPRRPRSQLPSKGTSGPNKGSDQAPILLSPESAIKQVGHQDFVFGTSSQLAREDSPTLLRDLHDAMQASNQISYDDPFAEPINESSTPDDLKPRQRSIGTTNRTLWSASARDVSGNLLDMEVIDMVNSPMIIKPHGGVAPQNTTYTTPNLDEVWHDVEDTIVPVSENSESRESALKITPATENATLSAMPIHPSKGEISGYQSPKPTRSSQAARVPFGPTQSSTASENCQMPDFDSYTTAQLTKELVSYHFKPIKNRDYMVKLLQKCWESKNRMALGTLVPNVRSLSPARSSEPIPPSSSQNNRESPTRPRGRPRKNSAVNTIASPTQPKAKGKVGRPKTTSKTKTLGLDSSAPLSKVPTPKASKPTVSRSVDEIYDSDPPTPSPPRRRPSQIRHSLPLKLSSLVDDDATALTPDSSQESLFIHITSAIKNGPPSKHPLEPSWQEKILLYDPIIIEDLTLWLNTGALEKEGWDGEVAPKEVKKWCARKSICCLWKENLRGAARSRY